MTVRFLRQVPASGYLPETFLDSFLLASGALGSLSLYVPHDALGLCYGHPHRPRTNYL